MGALMRILILVLILALSACTSKMKTFKGRDGKPEHQVKCGAIENCYYKATEFCGGKYKLIDSSINILTGSTLTFRCH
jgi:hypothetical protein